MESWGTGGLGGLEGPGCLGGSVGPEDSGGPGVPGVLASQDWVLLFHHALHEWAENVPQFVSHSFTSLFLVKKRTDLLKLLFWIFTRCIAIFYWLWWDIPLIERVVLNGKVDYYVMKLSFRTGKKTNNLQVLLSYQQHVVDVECVRKDHSPTKIEEFSRALVCFYFFHLGT